MSVTVTTNKVQYSGDAISSTFAFAFNIYATSDLVVTIKNNSAATVAGIAAAASVTLALTTDFTVTPTTSLLLGPSTGTITIVNSLYTSLPVGLLLTIRRVLPKTQQIRMVDNVNTPATTFSEAFDRAVMLIQELNELLSRSLTFDQSFSGTAPTLPALAAGALYCDGVSLAWQTLVTTATTYGASFSFGADASKAASPGLGAVYIATDTFKIYKCVSAGAWTTKMAFADVVTFSAAALNLAQAIAVASATTTDIGAVGGNYVHITGVVTITGLGTVAAGAHRWVTFDGILTLTHNATSLILPGGVSITTAAGDTALFVSEGSGNWRCIAYQKASGVAVVATTPSFQTAASQAQMEAATDNTTVVTPLNLNWHPGVMKAGGRFDGTGTPAFASRYNMDATITDNGTGDWTVAITTDFSGADKYYGGGMGKGAAAGSDPAALNIEGNPAAGTIDLELVTTQTGARVDSAVVMFALHGDQ